MEGRGSQNDKKEWTSDKLWVYSGPRRPPHMTYLQCLAVLLTFVFSSSAFAAQPEKFSFWVSARVSDASRSSEVRMEASHDKIPADKLLRISKEDVQLEIVPKSRDRENIVFTYRVSKKGMSLSSGEFLARVGQKSHLVVGHKKSGHLVSLAVRVPGQGVPFRHSAPSVLLGRQSLRYIPL